jgi:hypothetical protein
MRILNVVALWGGLLAVVLLSACQTPPEPIPRQSEATILSVAIRTLEKPRFKGLLKVGSLKYDPVYKAWWVHCKQVGTPVPDGDMTLLIHDRSLAVEAVYMASRERVW